MLCLLLIFNLLIFLFQFPHFLNIFKDFFEKIILGLLLISFSPLMTSHVELRQTLMSVSANCHLIKRLFFESSKTCIIAFNKILVMVSKLILIHMFLGINSNSHVSGLIGRDDSLKSPTCADLVNKCPHLTSLTL